jgi:hypothetical protein
MKPLYLLAVAALAGCAVSAPATLNQGVAYADALAVGLENTLKDISCPHQMKAGACVDATGAPVPNAILDPAVAVVYSQRLTNAHAALKALGSMPAAGGACLPALAAAGAQPATSAQSAPTPGACLVLISGVLTGLQTELAALGAK